MCSESEVEAVIQKDNEDYKAYLYAFVFYEYPLTGHHVAVDYLRSDSSSLYTVQLRRRAPCYWPATNTHLVNSDQQVDNLSSQRDVCHHAMQGQQASRGLFWLGPSTLSSLHRSAALLSSTTPSYFRLSHFFIPSPLLQHRNPKLPNHQFHPKVLDLPPLHTSQEDQAARRARCKSRLYPSSRLGTSHGHRPSTRQ